MNNNNTVSIYSNKLIKSINNFYIDGMFHDIVIVVEGKKIKAHKVILASSSDYFKSILCNDFLEKSLYEIKIFGIDYRTFITLIDYIYSGKIDINETNVEILLIKADYLQINTVVKLCEDYIKTKISISNCIRIFNFCKNFNRHKLMNMSLYYIIFHVSKLYDSPEFNNLQEDEIINILSNDLLNVIDEDIVALFIIKWLLYNNITSSSKKLLSVIRTKYLSKQIFRLLMDTKSICNNKECIDYLRTDINTLPRKMTEGYMLAIGGKDKHNKTYIEIMSPITNEWIVLSYMKYNKNMFNVALLDDIIYIIGGTIYGEITGSVLSYNLMTDTWGDVAALSSPRYGSSVVTKDSRIYIFGGKGKIGYLTKVESWKPNNSNWKRLPSLLEPRANISSVVVNDVIYLFGGIHENGNTGTYECIQDVEILTDNGWEKKTRLPKSVACCAVAAHNDDVFVAGGYIINVNGVINTVTDDVYMYNTIDNTWSDIPKLNIPRNDASLCYIYNKLYIIGGFTGNSYTNTVEVYDNEKCRWEESKPCTGLKYGKCIVNVRNKCPWKKYSYNKSFIKNVEKCIK
ncbi:kelch-like protein [Brazilian porcupinepox virus 1]|nr:kelch-like protein [Brazilian porcupinepox virus 1]